MWVYAPITHHIRSDRTLALPYFKFLKERGNDVGRADFARLQRETLENYLIGLIRAVVRLQWVDSS